MLDLNDLQYLTDADKARYMMTERLFAQPGWELVRSLIEKDYNTARESIVFARSWDENRVHFGAMQAFYSLLNLPEQIEREFEQLAAKAKADKTQAEEEQYE